MMDVAHPIRIKLKKLAHQSLNDLTPGHKCSGVLLPTIPSPIIISVQDKL